VADLRVGIVSWNTAELLGRCLAALPAALDGVDAEVVVVDNASADGSADVAARHAGVRVVRNPTNAGYPRAMNQALAGSAAPLLLALNPDTEPGPGTLAALVECARGAPHAGLVVPRLVHPDGSLQHSVLRFPSVRVALAAGLVPTRLRPRGLGRRWWLVGANPHDTSGPVDWAYGAVHLIRAEALGGEPPYSERWFMYSEDIEVCWRLHQRGWEVHLCAGVAVTHVGNAAGAQQWGGSRAARVWGAAYDFDALARGQLHARALAAANSLGVGLHWVVAAARRQRDLAAGFRAELPVHLRAAAAGPPTPDPPPGSDPAPR
jgi:GT2 family glycosyltransferase